MSERCWSTPIGWWNNDSNLPRVSLWDDDKTPQAGTQVPSKLDETYEVRIARPNNEDMDECKSRAEQRVRKQAQESVRATGWPQCKRCKMNLDLTISSAQTFNGDGATAKASWSKTCKHCGKFNG